jgi:hypothetical protein
MAGKLIDILVVGFDVNSARGTPVNIGEAVGVIAAQSISEPGSSHHCPPQLDRLLLKGKMTTMVATSTSSIIVESCSVRLTLKMILKMPVTVIFVLLQF